ncbi:hypothetical protein OBK11_09610 [Empedobacter falsenii]
MKSIIDIDNKLTTFDENLKKVVNELIFEEIGIFSYQDFFNENLNFNEFNYKGLYLFEIKNSFKFSDINEWKFDFEERWSNKDYLRKFVPNIRKKRMQKLNEIKEWIPLYIGKSKSVGKRIHEHIYKPLDKTTFAMKLKARVNLENEVFRISTIKVDVTNYNWILPVLENELRNELNPIVGKQ